MKRSFLEYLKEEQEYDFSNEKYIKFNESGDVIGTEKGKYEWQKYDSLFEDLDSHNNSLNEEQTFGGEYIIDMNWGDENIQEGKKQKTKKPKEDPATIKYLMSRGRKDIDDIKKDFINYTVEPPDAPQSGYVLKKRDFKDPSGERKELSPSDIEKIVKQKNKKVKPPPYFSFDDDNNFLKNGRPIQKRNKTNFIKKLNTKVEEWLNKNNDKRQLHFKWEGNLQYDKDDKKIDNRTDKLMINTSGWDDSDKQNLKRYDQATYEPLTDKKQQEFLLNIINTKDNSEEINKFRGEHTWGFDNDKKMFTHDGHLVYGDELLQMVNSLNSYFSDHKKQNGYEEEGSYWKHFKISVSGSKVGDVANFSLPPVITCNRDAPCIKDGCYAIKAYGQYPTTRFAQEVNLALFKKGKEGYTQFENEICKIFETESDQIKYFRFFVSGDVFSMKMMQSIINIANRCRGKCNFWMYTKQYAILQKFMNKIPSNLTVLVSCWGDFCPSLYDPKKQGKRISEEDIQKGIKGPYADIADNFPLAYLDDGSDNTQKYINSDREKVICPCTDDDEVVAHCDTCKKCFDVRNLKGNIVFKKH